MENINLISADEYQTSERFYALPKILFESDLYKEMRLDAKVFYAILKDRLSLSFKNNWFRVYRFFSIFPLLLNS